MLLKDPSNKLLRARLIEIGLDPDIIIKNKGLKDSDKLIAMYTGAAKTQFLSSSLDLPFWASSPSGKIFWQFKNFGYQQTQFLKDRLAFEFKNGNPAGAARILLILSTIFPMTGEVLLDIRSLITQSKRPTKFLDRYFDDLNMSGALAIIGDIYSSLKYGTLELDAPALSMMLNVSSSVLKDWDDPSKIIDTILRESGVGQPILNVKKGKVEGKESTLETIGRLLNE